MKKIGIFSKTWLKWDEKSEGLGGSETWILEVSSFLKERGYEVVIYSFPFYEHISENGVIFKNYSDYNGEYFDIAVISRICENYFQINAGHKFCFSHDILPWGLTEEMCRDTNFQGIGVLSEWHKNFILEHFPFVDEKQLFFFSNGYNEELYGNADKVEKENAMVWSSQPERGFNFLMEKVIPLIKEKIPDFKVYFCYPNYVGNGNEYLNKDVVFKGPLAKKELSDLQKKCKIWIYPNLGEKENGEFFFETFCITALENAMAGNAIITNDGGGLGTTLKGYEFMEKYDTGKISNNEEYAKTLAEKAILCLTDEYAYKMHTSSLYNICNGKTWYNSNRELLFNIKRMRFIKNADVILFKENGKDISEEKILFGNKKLLKYGSNVLYISSENKENFYCNSQYNEHHYTTNFHYNIVYPLLNDILGIAKNDLSEDFYKIENIKEDGDFSFMYPKKEKEFLIKYGKKEILENNRIYVAFTEKKCGFNFLYGEQINAFDYRNSSNYHRLFCLSHYPCNIENKGENNGKTLLISGDSHMIPLLPILAYYFKKVIYLDNRDFVSYRWLWENEEFDKALLCMGLSSYLDLNYYIEHNFE